jgi:hypothetical protein
MKEITKLAILIGVVGVFLISCGDDGPTTSQITPGIPEDEDVKAICWGTVYDSYTGFPLNGATVQVLDQLSGEQYGCDVTGPPWHPAGEYEVYDDPEPPPFNHNGTYCTVIASKRPTYGDVRYDWVLLPPGVGESVDFWLMPVCIQDR